MYEKEDVSVDESGYEMDDGTMPNNVADLESAVVGHKIASVVRGSVPNRYRSYIKQAESALLIRLDNGTEVALVDTDDCCAYTSLNAFLLNPELVDHVITGVGTTEGFTTWHIYADMGDVLQLSVGWSSGNPFYYGYGFDIRVREP